MVSDGAEQKAKVDAEVAGATKAVFQG